NNWSSATNVTLNVTDVNEADSTAPTVTASQSFNYAENQTAGATIGTVQATDNIAVTQFRFADSASSTSQDGFYQISNTGVITITAAGIAAGVANNDFETGANQFTYGIQAGDAANNWSSATNVTLNVTDVNEDSTIAVTGGNYNEASPRAVFTID
ncbi:cadherin repeat domain-containing protein, partial [Vulcanococcus sp. Clear-D1]|uniref:cadherin repeat domain-containing protein n=1 Tax=Vulcanococcus sp. Clear-D1 TaxID=2766970 RepID=UPI00199D3967